MLTVWVERGGIEDGVAATAATAAVAGGGVEDDGWVLVGLEILWGCIIIGRKERTTQRKAAVVCSNGFSNKGLFPLNERL